MFQKGLNKSDQWDATAPAYGRFWKDEPGTARTRVVIPLGICRTRSIAKRALAEHLEKTHINSTRMFVESTTTITFGEQAEIWLKSLSQRKRSPLEQTTIDRCRYTLDKHLSPYFGDMFLGNVNNLELKNFVEHIADTLAPATIRDYAGMVKAIVASAVDANGEELFPRKWNEQFIDAPVVRHQRQPSVHGSTLESILNEATGQYRVLYAILAGCGPMRIGEALGLEIKHISEDCRTLYIRQKAKRGKIQPYLKTAAGERDIDLCSSLATMLREFIGQRTSGLLFCTSEGTQLLQQNILRDSLHPVLKRVEHEQGGFNIFRRFRRTHLDKADCREALAHFWSGHAPRHVSERYIKLVGERDYRLSEAERIGTGFQVPKLGQPGQLIQFRGVA